MFLYQLGKRINTEYSGSILTITVLCEGRKVLVLRYHILVVFWTCRGQN